MELSTTMVQLEEALSDIPTNFNKANEILKNYTPTKEELAFLVYHLLDKCESEYFDYCEDLKRVVNEDFLSDHIYKVMQFLFKVGYDPNIPVEDDDYRPINHLQFINYPDWLAPRLMRLFFENGYDLNLLCDGETIFDQFDFAVACDEYYTKSTIYCWLVIMAYGGCFKGSKDTRVKMEDGYDISIFKHFEKYHHIEIYPTNHYFPCWKMQIYEEIGNRKFLVATAGDINGKIDIDLLLDKENEGYYG